MYHIYQLMNYELMEKLIFHGFDKIVDVRNF